MVDKMAVENSMGPYTSMVEMQVVHHRSRLSLFILAYKPAKHSCFAGTRCISLVHACVNSSVLLLCLLVWWDLEKVHLRFFHPLSTSSSRKGSGNQVIITSRCTSNQPHGFEIVGWFTRLTLTPLFPQILMMFVKPPTFQIPRWFHHPFAIFSKTRPCESKYDLVSKYRILPK